MSKQVLRISEAAMETLLHYWWPGNIRELQNFVERAVILTIDGVLQLPALPSHLPIQIEPVTLTEAERDHILDALTED
jgi:formate hydrogenlyase transcriptional activator